jgi:hypothetical protein
MMDGLQLGLLAGARLIRRRGIKENIAFVQSLGDVIGKKYRSHNGTGYVGTLTSLDPGYFQITATLEMPNGVKLMFPFETLIEVTE